MKNQNKSMQSIQNKHPKIPRYKYKYGKKKKLSRKLIQN